MGSFRWLAAASAAAMLAACSGGGTQIVPNPPTSTAQSSELTTLSTFEARNVTTGETVRIFPTRDIITGRSPQARSTSTNLLYHGGPVQTSPHLYVVFWGAAWNGSGDPDGVAAQLTGFSSVIGGSRWLASVTQYTQSDGQAVGNSKGIFAGSYVDASSTPPSHPTQSQMAAEAAAAAAHYGDYSANASYVVAMPHGIRPSGFGSQYCAYHTTTSAGGGTIAWTNLPYIPDAGYACGAGSVNTPGTLDGVSIVSGHEQGETETDPQPSTGWLDASGAENGDKCAWTGLENNRNAGGYPTQPLWSNASSSCVQSY